MHPAISTIHSVLSKSIKSLFTLYAGAFFFLTYYQFSCQKQTCTGKLKKAAQKQFRRFFPLISIMPFILNFTGTFVANHSMYMTFDQHLNHIQSHFYMQISYALQSSYLYVISLRMNHIRELPSNHHSSKRRITS